MTIISIVVVVVIIGGALGTYNAISHKETLSYHVGNASAAQVDNLSDKNLSKHYANNTSPSNSTEVAFDTVIFNETTNGSISGSVLLSSVEFHSTSDATDSYNSAYAAIIKGHSGNNVSLTMKNGTYGGFDYFTGTYSVSVYGITAYVFFAVGHASQFAFVLFDYYIPLTNSTLFVHDEINAMS